MPFTDTNVFAENASETLKRYLRNAGCDLSGDQEFEVENIVNDLIAAVLAEVQPRVEAMIAKERD